MAFHLSESEFVTCTLPGMTDVPFEGWCPQYQLKDMTGIDSIVAPVCSAILLVVCQLLPLPADLPGFRPTGKETDYEKSAWRHNKPKAKATATPEATTVKL